MDRAYEVQEQGANLTKKMHPSGQDDISLLAMQRLFNQYARPDAADVLINLDIFWSINLSP